MSDLNPAQSAPRLVSAGMAEQWSNLLPGPDRSAFVEACAEAEADSGRFQAVLSSYFSTWKTSLMADDLSRLEMLSTYTPIRDCIKVICLEDETDEFTLTPPPESSAIWPRHKDGQVIAEAIGVELLKSMLTAQQLRPNKLEIRDKREVNTVSDPETAAILARNVLDGADLAVTDFIIRKESPMTTIITAELSAEHQGRGIGYSNLRRAKLYLSQGLNSYWANKILLHAPPTLKELSLSFWQPRNIPHYPPSSFLDNTTLPALEKLELSMSLLSAPSIIAILSKSEQSLTGISFSLMTFAENSWAELLGHICNKFPHLTWFKLSLLAEGFTSHFKITFPGLDKDSVVGEPYKNGLKLRQRGPEGSKRINGVEYEGPYANHMLRIVAECAVAAPIRS